MRIKLSKTDIKQRILLTIAMTIIYIVFNYMYENTISPNNLYHGFIFHKLSPSEFLSSLLFYYFPLVFLPTSLKRPSDISLWMLYLFSYAPTAIMCFYITEKGTDSMIFLLFLMLFALITLKYFRHHTFNIYVKKKLNLMHLDKITFLLFFVSIVIVVLNLADFKFSIIDLLSAEVYERRMAARYMEKGIFTNYIISIGRSLLTILGIYLTFVKRKPIYGIFVILFSLAVFSYDGTKTALLNPLFLTAIYLICSHSKYLIFLPSLLGIIVVLSFLEFNILETNILSELLTRRIISVPGFLNTVYWDFFSENSKALLTDSIGKYFFDQVYDMPVTFIIGLEYFNNVETNANTGIWMGGFAHFGVIGIFMVSIIAGFLLGFIDNLTQKNYFMFGTLVCAYIGMNWSEQMLHTSMLTGGVFYILLFLIFLQHSNLIDAEEFSSNKIKGKSLICQPRLQS